MNNKDWLSEYINSLSYMDDKVTELTENEKFLLEYISNDLGITLDDINSKDINWLKAKIREKRIDSIIK